MVGDDSGIIRLKHARIATLSLPVNGREIKAGNRLKLFFLYNN